MAITVSLVGSDTPQRVQIVVSATTAGLAWTLYGAAGDMEWIVPGGEGVGDGNQLTLTDNRGPLNLPITYRYVTTSATQTASPITVVQVTGDAVLQSLDGQKLAVVELQDGTQEYELEPNLELFRIPGRRRPVARYSVTSDVVGQLIMKTPLVDTPSVDVLLASGQPLLCRMTGPTLDMPLVSILGITRISTTARLIAELRYWTLSYVTLDDPYMDERLGAFSWDYFDSVWAGDTWDQFATTMSGRSWNQFDAIDWSTI